MYVWGKDNYNKQSWKFWISAIIPIFCFAIITGCRTWGADYNWYKYKMTHPTDFTVKKDEYLFLCLNGVIRFFNLDGEAGFIVYSAIIIVGAFIFIRSFKYSKYMYALLLPAILIEPMNHIRQGIAFGVSLIALGFLNKENWKMFALFSLIALNIHSVSILLPITCLALFCCKNWIIPVQASVPIYCIAIFLPEYIDYTFIQKIVSVLPVEGSKYVNYVKSMSNWFSINANNIDWKQSSVALVLSALFDISIIILSYGYLKKINNPIINIYYNLSVTGAILVRIFFLNEILRRTFTMYYMFYFVPLGFCFFLHNIDRLPLGQKRVNTVMTCFGCIMIYLFAYWSRFIFFNKEGFFIWQ